MRLALPDRRFLQINKVSVTFVCSGGRDSARFVGAVRRAGEGVREPASGRDSTVIFIIMKGQIRGLAGLGRGILIIKGTRLARDNKILIFLVPSLPMRDNFAYRA
jgi:hypothetical protein